jgi:prepilin-type N-terminal cleavage/methylation domain-containing protein
MRRNAGFTLVEIAVVLVVIGLLLGAVLKGQELMTSARVRNLMERQDEIKAGDATRGTFRAMLSPSITPTDCYSADGAWRIEASGTNCGGTTLF